MVKPAMQSRLQPEAGQRDTSSNAPVLNVVPFDSTPARFLAQAARLGLRPAYFVRGIHGWEPHSWTEFAAEAQTAARALIALGVQRGDVVCILGFNRPEWVIMDHAAMMVGAVPAGIYWTSSADEVGYILNHSKAPVVLVENEDRYERVAVQRGKLPHLRHVVMMKGAAAHNGGTMTWEQFLALGDAYHQAELERRLNSISPEHPGTLIYTSGTTGPAKAVELSHGNLAWTAKALSGVFSLNETDRLISYLPLAHIAEQMGAIHNQALMGFSIYFARSIEELADHLKEVRPTVFFGVPRVWEKMLAAIQLKLSEATGVKAKLAAWAQSVGQRWHAGVLAGRSPSLGLRLQKALADKLVHGKVKAAMGFDQARLLITGAAPIAPETLLFFTGLDLSVYELYGQSEVSGPTSLNMPGAVKVGSVGKLIPGMEVKIADDGEILVRGPNVFQGYVGMPEQTAETLIDGWLHSGDLGRVDEDGFLYITGRKKDLLITSGGKNISPGNIEADLMNVPLIEHAVVCGDGRHFLSALITLKADALAEFAKHRNLPPVDLHAHPLVEETLRLAIDEINRHHARVANIRKFRVLDYTFTIEAGELTPTMKVKRKVVINKFQDVVESMYRD